MWYQGNAICAVKSFDQAGLTMSQALWLCAPGKVADSAATGRLVLILINSLLRAWD